MYIIVQYLQYYTQYTKHNRFTIMDKSRNLLSEQTMNRMFAADTVNLGWIPHQITNMVFKTFLLDVSNWKERMRSRHEVPTKVLLEGTWLKLFCSKNVLFRRRAEQTGAIPS